MNFHVIVPCGEDSREGDLPGLFEFHRPCRLRCKIIQHAVNSRNLVLEQNPNRLHQLKIHIFRQSARIVVRLDAFLRFEDVRPNGALRQELDAVQFSRLFRKHLDKFVSDDHSLFLRIVYPGKLVRIISNVVCGPLTV